jgi:hypothetical protein
MDTNCHHKFTSQPSWMNARSHRRINTQHYMTSVVASVVTGSGEWLVGGLRHHGRRAILWWLMADGFSTASDLWRIRWEIQFIPTIGSAIPSNTLRIAHHTVISTHTCQQSAMTKQPSLRHQSTSLTFSTLCWVSMEGECRFGIWLWEFETYVLISKQICDCVVCV